MLITFKLWPITTKAQRVFTLGNPFQNHVPCPRDQPVTSSLPLRTRWWWSWWGAHFDWSLYMNMFNDQLSIYDVIVYYRINAPWCEEDCSRFNALLSFKTKTHSLDWCHSPTRYAILWYLIIKCFSKLIPI